LRGRILLAVGSIVVCLLGAEVLLAVVAPQVHRLPDIWMHDARLGWTHRPGTMGRMVTPEFDVAYSIDAAGQNLVASLTGPYLTVEDHANPSVVLSLTQRSTSPDFVFNPTPDEATTAQVNAFVVANKVVDFYLQHHPALEATFAANNVFNLSRAGQHGNHGAATTHHLRCTLRSHSTLANQFIHSC
jgi:hypothetical protein